MRKVSIVLTATLLIGGLAMAQDLDGRKIELVAGDTKVLNAPLTLPCDAKDVDGILTVVESKTGKSMPATLRDGELVFICEGALPNTTHIYQVKVEDDDQDKTPKVVIKKQDDKDILDVLIDDVHFTSYHFSNDWKKPFLWPVLSEGQVGVTRDYPMSEEGIPKYAKDHPHHKSLYAAYGEVNEVDCWAEGGNSGFQHSDDVTWGSGDAYGWIKAKNTWQDGDHKPIISEAREYRFYAVPEKGRLIDAFLTFTADQGPVTFHDTKEGGMVGVRMRPELSYAKGIITNALGDVGESNCWGKPSPWCDYSGEMEDIGWRGLTVFDHPANLRHPTSWHVRKYGLMGANCFGYSYFSEKEHNKGLIPENGDYVFKEDEQLSFKHRVYVHTGDVKKAAVADRYADFAAPPKVTWKD